TYTVTVTAENGCTDTDETTVTVNPLPTANAGNDVTVCAGESTTLTATGGGTYSWSGGVTNGVPFIPTQSETYTVTVTAENGCTDTDETIVTVDECTSDQILSNFSNLKSDLYPNPALNEFTLEITSSEPEILVRIYSIRSQEIYSRKFENIKGVLKEKIDLNGHIPGMYLVRVNDGKEKRTKKIILK
ncbi:MAG TPA: T9SS type A sorting domain-containing protein, partial [Prolixibacteraceae bacterium]|nr:T9SS type A sorting domain-containing protein [Prolixibacteraceae bacterium]